MQQINKEYFIMKSAGFLRNVILTSTIENDINDSITYIMKLT